MKKLIKPVLQIVSVLLNVLVLLTVSVSPKVYLFQKFHNFTNVCSTFSNFKF